MVRSWVLISGMLAMCAASTGCPRRGPTGAWPAAGSLPPAQECARIAAWLAPGQSGLEAACERLGPAVARKAEAGGVLWFAPSGAQPAADAVAGSVAAAYPAQGRTAPTAPGFLTIEGRLDAAPRALAQGVGQAFAASAVAWQGPDDTRIVPVMPLASRLVLGAPAGLSVRADAARAASASVLAHRADAAFGQADFAGACILGQAALEHMPASGGCSARGPLLYMIWKAAGQSGCDLDEAYQQLETQCLQADLPEAEGPAQAFFSLLVELESKRGSGWSQDEFPEEWAARKDRQAALAAMRLRAEPLTGPRRELIGALLDEVVAFALRPKGPCDDETPARRQAELDRTAEVLYRLGRSDLSAHVPGGGPDPQVGKVDPDHLERQRAVALSPDNQWRRKELLGSLLMQVWAAFGTNPDPVYTRPLCKDYYAELERRLALDTWPDRSDRNLGLLTGSFLAAAACPDRTALQTMFRQVLDQAGQGERGKLGVLAALGSMLPSLFEAVMSGQSTRLLTTLEHVHLAVSHRVGGLSDSLEDRALGACLQVFLAIQPLVQGRVDQVVERFDQAERGLAELPFPPADDDPMLVRLGPGLHLAAGYGLVGAYALAGRTELVAPLLARMRPDLERAVPYTLQALEAGEHAPAAVAISLALQTVLERLTATEEAGPEQLAEMAAAIERAWPPLPEQGGWWQVGLLAANLTLSDYVALAYSETLGAEGEARMLERGGQELAKLCERARTWFDLEGPDFDFVRMLPVAHGVLERAMALPDETPDRLTAALLAIEPRLNQTLAKLESARSPQARLTYLVERGSLPGLFMEAVWTAREVGWERLIKAQGSVPAALLARLERVDAALAKAGRVELRLLLDLMLGGLFELAGEPDQAQAWLGRASGTMDDTDLIDAHPYVLAARAAVVADDDGPAARSLLREAMAPSRQARKCQRTHPTDALGLPQAWLAARAGQSELALAQIDAYLERVAAGSEGDGRIKCLYKFHGDQLIIQTTLEIALTNLLQSTSSDSSWQVGAGAQSVAMDRESLVCVAQPFGYRRHDKQLIAELTGAVYALLQGNDPAADGYLRRAHATLARIDNGSPATLEPFDAGGLEPAREKLYTPLLFWAGVLAQLRGHTAIGGMLEKRAGRSGAEDPKDRLDNAGLLPDSPPAYLAGVPGIAQVRPLLELWYTENVRRNGPSEALMALIRATAKEQPKAIPTWSPTLVRVAWLVGEGKPEEAFEQLKASPADHRRHHRVGLLIALLGQVIKGVELKAEGLGLEMERAVAAGYLPEALEAADVLMDGLVEKEGPAAAERIDRALRSTKAHALDAYSAGQADLLLARVFLAKGDLARVRKLLLSNLDRHNGLFPLQQQLGREWEVVFLGLRLGLFEPTLARIQARLPLFGRALGFESQAVFELEVRALALQVLLAKDYDPAQIDRLLARAQALGPAVEASRALLAAVKTALSSDQDPVPACRTYLKG